MPLSWEWSRYNPAGFVTISCPFFNHLPAAIHSEWDNLSSIERSQQPNKMVGHVTFHPAEYSTMTLDEPYSDWRGYSTLVISLFSPRVDLFNSTVRVEDQQHNGDYSDRFNATYEIRPGPNLIQIPLDRIASAPATRRMDMSAIASLALFVANPKDTLSLYVDSISLR
jgi:hypothetical protein